MLAGRMGGGGMRPPENDLKKASFKIEMRTKL